MRQRQAPRLSHRRTSMRRRALDKGPTAQRSATARSASSSPSIGWFRQASIWPWIFLLRLDTVLGLTRVVPHGASVMSSTRRTDTPAAVDECGWPLARSPAKLPPVRSGARNGDSRSSARVAAVQLVTKWYRIGSC